MTRNYKMQKENNNITVYRRRFGLNRRGYCYAGPPVSDTQVTAGGLGQIAGGNFCVTYSWVPPWLYLLRLSRRDPQIDKSPIPKFTKRAVRRLPPSLPPQVGPLSPPSLSPPSPSRPRPRSRRRRPNWPPHLADAVDRVEELVDGAASQTPTSQTPSTSPSPPRGPAAGTRLLSNPHPDVPAVTTHQCYLSEQIEEIYFTITNQSIFGKPISLQNCVEKFNVNRLKCRLELQLK